MSKKEQHQDCFTPAILLIVMLGVILLVIIVALFKYFQLSRIQKAIENAWFTPGTCLGELDSLRCKLHYDNELAPPPTATVPTDFSFKLARRLIDYVARVSLFNQPLVHPPGHTPIYASKNHPPFCRGWSSGTTLVFAFRATVTHSEIQDDLSAEQVDFDTHRLLRTSRQEEPNIFGARSYVHAGFASVYRRYQAEILDVIQKHQPTLVLFCGHSLGGTVATLMSLALAELRSALFPFVNQVCGYVFGTPRVGNGHFDARLQATPNLTFWRMVNAADNIQDLPLRVTPNFKFPRDQPFYYEHAGREHRYDDNRGSWRTNHNLANYIHQCTTPEN